MSVQTNKCSRLMSLGIPKTESSQIVKTIDKWATQSGEEWTVQRLKEFKQIYLHRLAGSRYRPVQWIATDVNGIPKGPLKSLFKISSKRKLSKALTALSAHTSFISQEMTSAQKDKFFSSMESDDLTGLDSKPSIRLEDSHPSARAMKQCPEPPTIVEYCVGGTNAPGGDGLTTIPERDVYNSLLHGARSNEVRMIVAEHEDYFEKIIPVNHFFNVHPHGYDEPVKHNVGRISVIQEPGYKARAVANPSRVLQAALEPLKVVLDKGLKALSTDCTHDQISGVHKVQSWLKQGKKVYSVDLSDATNLFPWNYQKTVLEQNVRYPGAEVHIDIMDRCATGTWATSLKSGNYERVSFTRGQPLGLGPSFHTFALTHNLLLTGICRKLGVKPSDSFRVLGDDVVIGNDDLHRSYRSTLKNLGCKVSESKTFASDKMAEFAGYTILSDTYGKGYKWRDISDRSFLDTARNLGKSSLGFLETSQRIIAKEMFRAHSQLGGLSRSPGDLDDFMSMIYGQKEEKIVYTPSRDLVLDSIALMRRFEAGLGDRALRASDIRNIGVLDEWDSPRLQRAVSARAAAGEVVKPHNAVKAMGALTEWEYPYHRPSGDPRPSCHSLLAMITVNDESREHFSEAFHRAVSKFIRRTDVSRTRSRTLKREANRHSRNKKSKGLRL